MVTDTVFKKKINTRVTLTSVQKLDCKSVYPIRDQKFHRRGALQGKDEKPILSWSPKKP